MGTTALGLCGVALSACALVAVGACLPDYVLVEQGSGGAHPGATSATRAATGAGGGDAGPDAPACSDMTCDPANCGRPGHDCRGGACAGGVCQPLVLASARVGPDAIALTAERFYWRDTGSWTIFTCPLIGCGAGNAAAQALDIGPLGEGDLVVGGGSLFWATDSTNGQVRKCGLPLCLGGAQVMADKLDSPLGVAVDGASFYFTTTRQGGAVMRCPLFGCGAGNADAFTYASGVDVPTRVAVTGTAIYWTQYPGDVVTCSLSGCGAGPTTIIGGVAGAQALALDATSVYWGNGLPPYGIFRCPLAGCGGNPPIRVGLTDKPASTIVVDGPFVYWAYNGDQAMPDGFIQRVPVAGGATETVASNLPSPWALAMDATFVYWVNRGTSGVDYKDGSIVRLPK